MTRTHRLVPVLLVALPLLGACKDSAQVGNAVRGASELQCNQARRDYVSAVENYSILEAKVPTSEMELVPQYLRMPSDLMDVDATGNVVAQPGGGCD